ncbi:MAG: hypothetical protein JSW73_03610 [Candidatus Woesearchaeota archaeon]|nr:MAG: hypothetical protein JSW73_03610 [Candidatus Woesearchaeota archaeon]
MNLKIIIPILIIGLVFTSGCIDSLKEIITDIVFKVAEETGDKVEVPCPKQVLQYFLEETTIYSDTSPFDKSSDWYSEKQVPILDIPVNNEAPCHMGNKEGEDDTKLYCIYISPCLEQNGKYIKGKIYLTYDVSAEEKEASPINIEGAAVVELSTSKYGVTLTMIDCKARQIMKDTLEECEDTQFTS